MLTWRRSLETYAPWAHAWLFAQTGDFSRAHALMAEALQHGFSGRRRRYFLSASVRTCLQTLERCLRETFENALGVEAPVGEGSFSRSSKLQSLRHAVDIVRSFPEKERMAFVLLFVDQVPELQASEWLKMDSPALAEFRSRVEARLDPEALERIRQFRISEAFLSGVLSSIDHGNSGTFTLTRALVLVLVLLAGATLVFRRGGLGLLEILYALGAPGLWTTFFMVVGVFSLRWVYQAASPVGISSPDPEVSKLGEMTTFATIPLLSAHAIVIFRPELLIRGDLLYPHSLTVDQVLWAAAVIVLESIAVFRLLRHNLPALVHGVLPKRSVGKIQDRS